jgi:hypothetical protein
LNRQIDDRNAGLMAGLKSKVASEQASLDALTAQIEKDKGEIAQVKPYWDAKQKLDQSLDVHKLLSAKIEAT